MSDPLALGSVMYQKDSSAAQLTEEAIWLFGDEAVEKFADRQQKHVTSSQAFPDGGIYVLADSQPYPEVMMVDAGPQGVGRSGHGHADALSLRLTMNGRRWLVDSGSGVYISKDSADRDAFRGTGAHNTMRVDGADQAVADEPFSWKQLPTTSAETWIAGETFSYFVGSHNGYARLADPVVHRRHVFKIAGDLWLVRDVAEGNGEHEIEVRWHFAPDLDVRSAGAGHVQVANRKSSHLSDSAGSSLSLLVPEQTAWQSATEVTRTVLSPAYGALEPASTVRCHARMQLPAELGTVLIPRPETMPREEPAGPQQLSLPRFAAMSQATVQVYELAYQDASYGFFFARADKLWSFGPWSSDARMLYCRIDQEKLDHFVLIGGTQVLFQGKPMLKASRPSEYFEWRRQGSVMNAAGGDFSFTALFETLTGTQMSRDSHRVGMHSITSSSDRDSSSYAEKH
jgi:hypothetical protein